MQQICVSDTDDYSAFRKADRKMKKFMTFITYFLATSFTLCIAVAGIPLVKKKLIFDIAFPWNYKTKKFAFWMAYALVAGVYTLSVTIVCFSSMMWYMMMSFVVKYELLGNDFKNLGFFENDGMNSKSLTSLSAPSVNETIYVQDLVMTIKNLENVNRLLEEFTTFFSSLFLFQVVTSSTCICGTIYCLAFVRFFLTQ